MMRFSSVSFQYRGADAPIIAGLSFEVQNREFVSVIGASGCGKTTLFRLLNGLETIQSGSIEVDGRNINDLKNYSAYMPQKDMLLPWLTVEKNVMLPMTVQNTSREEALAACGKMLETVGLLEYKDKHPRELSGGMRQRVAFARTLCVGSDLLLLDEPFSALDSITRISMQEWLLAQWAKVGKTVLFITHDVEEAIFLSSRILIITERPVSQMEHVEIGLPYPRSREMLEQPEIARLKESLISRLRTE